MQNNNIPRLWLISAANAAVSPTASVMGKFYEVTVRMSKKGDLTEDEAANLRYSTYARAEIMSVCGGNPDMLDDTSVLAVRDRVRAKYTEKEAADIHSGDVKHGNQSCYFYISGGRKSHSDTVWSGR